MAGTKGPGGVCNSTEGYNLRGGSVMERKAYTNLRQVRISRRISMDDGRERPEKWDVQKRWPGKAGSPHRGGKAESVQSKSRESGVSWRHLA